MKIALVWRRFGPYHLSRLTGLAEALRGERAAVVGIGVAQSDHYEWTAQDAPSDESVRTLFPGRDYESLRRSEVRSAMFQALDAERPAAVAINGWAVPEARAALEWCAARAGTAAILMSETKEDDSARSWWKEAIKKRLIRKADAALVGGRAQRDYLVKLGMPGERIFLGYDAVDNDHFGSGADRARADASLRSRLRLPPRYFLACTRFLARKNVDGLLRGYARYRRQRGDDAWGLVVAGSGSEGRALRSLAEELGLSDVGWPGFVQYDKLPAYYGLAGGFVHPAHQEAWGLVVNEAAASGLPLLVSRTVGARYELVEDGDNGFLFDPGDDGAIAAAMLRVADLDGAERRRMGDRSRAIVADFSPRRFGEGMLAAIKAGRRAKADR